MLTRLTFIVWYASIALEAGLAVRLAYAKLLRRYAAFAVWALADCVSALVLVQLHTNAGLYLRAYVAGQAIVAISEFFAVGSIFSAHLEVYPGIGSFGRKLLSALAGLSGVVSILVIHFDWVNAGKPVDVVLAASRIASSSFAVFLISASLFFRRYRVPTKPNVLALERGATGFFALQALAFFALLTFGSRANAVGSLVIQAAICALFLYWNIVLGRSGEFVPEQPVYNEAEHDRVEFLNQEALRWAKNARAALRRGRRN